MSGARSREKGLRWQSDLALRWRTSGLFPAARSTQGEQVRGPHLGARPPDVEGTPYAVEAKHMRIGAAPLGKPVIAALEQGEREAAQRGDAREVIAVVRPHGCGEDAAIVVQRMYVGGPPKAMRLPDWEANALEWAKWMRGEGP